jgi:hypothetical protein
MQVGWARHGQENYCAPDRRGLETGGRGLATTHGVRARHDQLTRLVRRAGEVNYCSFFAFAASKRSRLMAKRSSTKPAANARITINRIVSTPMRTPPDVF